VRLVSICVECGGISLCMREVWRGGMNALSAADAAVMDAVIGGAGIPRPYVC